MYNKNNDNYRYFTSDGVISIVKNDFQIGRIKYDGNCYYIIYNGHAKNKIKCSTLVDCKKIIENEI